MLAFIYIIVCLTVGFTVSDMILKNLNTPTLQTFKGKVTDVSSLFLKIPIWYTTGTLLVTWSVYLLACAFKNTENPLTVANAIAVPVFAVGAIIMILLHREGRIKNVKETVRNLEGVEIIAFAVVTAIFLLLFYNTLYVTDNELHVGLSVFSDFSTHLSMIRSFSHNNNFSTQYTFYAGQDVKYHFMFQFLCGNLEYLGMRLDHAFNISSLLSVVCTYMALYALAVKLTGKRAVGIISMLFLTFRSSFSFFIYAADQPKGMVWENLKETDGFIGSTNHEDWGLWNLNVYCNQRHLAFCLAVALIVIVLLMPALFAGFSRIKRSYIERIGGEAEGKKINTTDAVLAGVKAFVIDGLWSKDGWIPGEIKVAIFAGFLLGLSGFWNGAVLLATVMVLFFMAIVAGRRLEFVITAAIAGILSMIQSGSFVDGSVFDAEYFYGFLSDKGTLFSSIEYIVKLMGFLPIVLLVCFVISKGYYKYIMVCFSIPFIFAFCISLTPDIAVNHKYIMFAVMLLNIPAADFVVKLFENSSLWIKGLLVMLVIAMTITGAFELNILKKMNTDERSFSYEQEDEVVRWVWENAKHNDIFLTPNYYLSSRGTGSSLILSGAMLYDGWQYFSWSAGYDTASRDEMVRDIYEAEDVWELYSLVEDAGVRYIVVDFNARISEDYVVNEELIDSAFGSVFTSGDGEWKTTIYDTKIRLE